MNQAELIIDAIERLSLPEKEVSVREKVFIEVLDHAPLGSDIEINENVAAEDQVHARHEGHASVVGEIEASEAHTLSRRQLQLQLVAHRDKVFLLVEWRDVASAVSAV